MSAIFLFSLFVDSAYAAITLNWTAPATNTDGSPITDLQGYNIYYYGPTSAPCSNAFSPPIDIPGKTTSTYTLSSLVAGKYCFAVTAYNIQGLESPYSNIISKTEAGTPDTTATLITAFTISPASMPYTAYITSLAATDNVGVTGYLINESATPPDATASGWDAVVPTAYIFAAAGSKTLYAWVKDAAGNVSASLSASLTIEASKHDHYQPDSCS